MNIQLTYKMQGFNCKALIIVDVMPDTYKLRIFMHTQEKINLHFTSN